MLRTKRAWLFIALTRRALRAARRWSGHPDPRCRTHVVARNRRTAGRAVDGVDRARRSSPGRRRSDGRATTCRPTWRRRQGARQRASCTATELMIVLTPRAWPGAGTPGRRRPVSRCGNRGASPPIAAASGWLGRHRDRTCITRSPPGPWRMPIPIYRHNPHERISAWCSDRPATGSRAVARSRGRRVSLDDRRRPHRASAVGSRRAGGREPRSATIGSACAKATSSSARCASSSSTFHSDECCRSVPSHAARPPSTSSTSVVITVSCSECSASAAPATRWPTGSG